MGFHPPSSIALSNLSCLPSQRHGWRCGAEERPCATTARDVAVGHQRDACRASVDVVDLVPVVCRHRALHRAQNEGRTRVAVDDLTRALPAARTKRQLRPSCSLAASRHPFDPRHPPSTHSPSPSAPPTPRRRASESPLQPTVFASGHASASASIRSSRTTTGSPSMRRKSVSLVTKSAQLVLRAVAACKASERRQPRSGADTGGVFPSCQGCRDEVHLRAARMERKSISRRTLPSRSGLTRVSNATSSLLTKVKRPALASSHIGASRL